MSIVTITATVEPGFTPPRVRLDVTDIGTPNLFAVTVTRLDPDGRTVPVRTLDGNPLTLSTSGANRVGLIYDYEMPYGAPVSYSTVESPATISAEVTIPETRIWLVHPGVPALSMPIEARAGSFDEETWDVQQGVFWPMGRETPIVATAGARQAASGSVTVAIDTLDQLESLRDLLRDAAPLLLNVPATLNFGVDRAYIAVGGARNRRLTTIGSDQYRNVDLPFQVVARPAGGSTSSRTYTDLLVYPSYSALMTAYSSYADLLAGP